MQTEVYIPCQYEIAKSATAETPPTIAKVAQDPETTPAVMVAVDARATKKSMITRFVKPLKSELPSLKRETDLPLQRSSDRVS